MIATLLGHAVQLSGLDILWVALAGLAAGGINSVVGSGTLITFPLLLALGYPPVMANVSNTVGLVPGLPKRFPSSTISSLILDIFPLPLSLLSRGTLPAPYVLFEEIPEQVF